ncbi:MAG: PIN domain-containing protein [Planctomycetes bacterium]|nr:PIN domain-containing protein [Planctomycetota bacterium]
MTDSAVVADTSGLLVLLDGAHRDHDRVLGIVVSLDRPLVVPGPVLVELDHLSRRFGRRGFRTLLADLEAGAYELEPVLSEDLPAILSLWDRYRALEPDYADLAVVRVAERLGTNRVLTFDHRDFRVLRAGRRPFVLLPADA